MTTSFFIRAVKFGMACLAALCFAAPAIAQTIPDATASLTLNGGPVAVTVSTSGQAISYTFSATAGQTVSLLASNDTFPDYLVSTVTQPNGTSIGTFYGNNIGAISGSIILSNLPASGTYTVRMVPSYFSNSNGNYYPGGETGSVSLLVESEVTGAIAANSNSLISLSLQPGQEAIYTFPGMAGQFLDAGLVSVSSTNNGTLGMIITNPDGSTLTNFSVYNGNTTYQSLPMLAQSGTYTATISSGIPSSTSSATVVFNGDATATLAPNASPANVNVTEPGQAVSYTFSGSAGQMVTLAVIGNTFPDLLAASVYQPDGTLIRSTYFENGPSASTVNGTMVLQLPASGTYTMRLVPAYYYNGQLMPDAGIGSVSVGLEPQITGAVAPGSNTPIPLNLEPGQVATYTYAATAGQFLNAGLTAVSTTPANGTVNVEITDPNGAYVTAFSVNDGSSYYMPAVAAALSGNYTATVAINGNNAATATLDFNGDLMATLTPGASPVTATVTETGQAISYTFTGSAGQALSLAYSANTFFSELLGNVYAPNGGSIGSAFVGSGAGVVGTTTLPPLPASGTYTLRLVPSSSGYNGFTPNGATGSVTVELDSQVSGTLPANGGSGTQINLSPGQTASYTFVGTAGQYLNAGLASVSTTPSNGTLVMTITQPDGSNLLTLNAQDGTSTFYPSAPLLTQSGNYTVAVAVSGTNAASAVVAVSSDVAAGLTLGGAAVPLAISIPGQGADYTFTGAVNQSVILTFGNDTVLGRMSYTTYQPDGTLFGLGFLYYDGTTPASGTLTLSNLTEAGTYLVRLMPLSYPQGSPVPDGAVGTISASYVNVLIPQTISFPVIGNINIGTPVALNAVASSGLAVSYASTTPAVCTLAGNAVSIIGAGTCSITATQAGNLYYSAAAAVTQTFSVMAPAAPSVALSSPAAGQRSSAPGNFTLTAATSSSATITQVQYYSGGALIGTATQAPYSVVWSNVPPGTYVLTANAIDSGDAVGTSAPVTVTVTNPLAVVLTGPANGQTVQANTTITLGAGVSDSVGTVTQVAYYNNEGLIGTVSQAPYTFNIPNAAAGSYSITASATDSNGYSATSQAVDFIVAASGFSNIGGTDTIRDIHTDQLGTPRMITDQSGNVSWQWDNQEPFGNNVSNQNPSGTGSQYVFNLRFRGQYFDIETGSYYNRFRDYNSAIGRFLESDLIGLRGASFSTYSYVGSNPLKRTDPLGLGPAGAALGRAAGGWIAGALGAETGPGELAIVPFGQFVGGMAGSAFENWVESSDAGDDNPWTNGDDVWTDNDPTASNRYDNDDRGGMCRMKNSKYNGNTPGPNDKQNEQTDSIASKLGLNVQQQEILHSEISGQGYSYQEIMEIAKAIKNGIY